MPEQIFIYTEPRNEEINDIISRIPGSLVRYGTLVISIVILFFFLGTWFIQYPDIVNAQLSVTAVNKPTSISTKISGKLTHLAINENSFVKKNGIIGWMESTANHKQVINLSAQLEKVNDLLKKEDIEKAIKTGDLDYNDLGELQPAFQNFNQQYVQLKSLLTQGFYLKKKEMLKHEIANIQLQDKNLQQQLEIQQNDLSISKGEFEAQKKLATGGVISPIEIKREESKLLSKSLPIKQTEASIIANTSAGIAKTNELLELDKAFIELKTNFYQALNTLRSEVDKWKSNYLLISPVNGYLQFASIIQENQSFTTGQELFYISQANTFNFCELKVPQRALGKVKLEQKVIIRLDGYPYEEFGFINGRVSYISSIPDKDGNYLAKVDFKNITTYNKTLTLKNGMTGSADIITDDLRLTERFFNASRALFKN